MSFGVSCDYDCESSALQVSCVSSFQLEKPEPLAQRPPPESPDSIDTLIDGMVNAPLYLHVDDGLEGPNVVYIDIPHLDLLRKFHDRSILTLGSADTSPVYRDVLTRTACRHSFVLHAVLRFALMHDRYLYDPIETKASAAESFHAYHAAALFSKRLAGPIEEEVKDSLWGCAALMGAMSFASIEATSPQETWPLKSPEITDLDWLKMSDGKKEVWRLVDPLRETSAFRPAVQVEHGKRQEGIPSRPMDPQLDKLFPFFTKLYNLDQPFADYENDPYHKAASILEKLIPLDCNHSTVMWFLSFLGHMDPEYRRLLEAKDPSALLLLAWWHAKMIPYNSWWVSRRGLLECQAICISLDKTLPPEHEMRRLLGFPRSASGLSRASFAEEWS
ncbi:Hypothetical predicted protein [Lecanosticta acicola]|uniref:Uncharacterized protein n=1 Tax=Lecanosticta acicola TaxID=111012 RepID=A0AAI8YYY3_9PEZI|nr:Hypothetical predicted protein [Lecanosticta acicola]